MLFTVRGTFEVFVTGEGDPIGITHYYRAFTNRGNYFADRFAGLGKVILINLKECGNSNRIAEEHELNMTESVEDLEANSGSAPMREPNFALYVNDAESLHQSLKASGVEVTDRVRRADHAEFFVIDSDGNKIGLIQRF